MKPQHLLILRLSSLGDIAMTVPVIRLLLQQHPSITVTMVSVEFARPLFKDIARLQFHAANIRGDHKGVRGLLKLAGALKKDYDFDAVADLHDVLRTKMLRFYLSFSRKPIAVINKGRTEKKELTRAYHKNLRPLKSTFQRYADVFETLGLPVKLDTAAGKTPVFSEETLVLLKQQGFQLIGIAPFALHEEKTYPPEKMKEVIRLLSAHKQLKIFLLGGKNEEKELEHWTGLSGQVTSLAGKMDFQNELHHISMLDLVVSMDSANMHLASLYGVPVVSVWGGTHPYLGFYGWGQSPENAVQVDLDCRPSSVFGNKSCRNQGACMKMISPLMIYEKIIGVLKS
ncbi:MAG: glycosyltransferase family 9 protein [Flavisolibacter sp.]